MAPRGAPPGAPPGPPQDPPRDLVIGFLAHNWVPVTGRPRGTPQGGPPGPAPGPRPPIGGAPPRGDEGPRVVAHTQAQSPKRGETWCDRPQKRGKNTHKGLKLDPFWAPLQGAHPVRFWGGPPGPPQDPDRKSVVLGKSVGSRVDHGGRGMLKPHKQRKTRGETWCDRPQKRGKNTLKGLKLDPFWAPLQGAHPVRFWGGPPGAPPGPDRKSVV
jgi:hypothetical protein